MLAKSKLGIIHVAKSQLGLDEDSYRDLLWQVAGVRSSRQLSSAGFDRLMDRLATLGFVSTSKARPLAPRLGMASPGQVQKIRAMWLAYTDGRGDDSSLGKWLEGRFKISSVRFVTAETGHKAIGALAAMLKKKEVKEAMATGSP